MPPPATTSRSEPHHAPSRFPPPTRDRYLSYRSEGHSTASAAALCHISPATIYRTRRDDPTFADAERHAEAEALNLVEDALYRSATGQPHPDELRHAAETEAQNPDPERPYIRPPVRPDIKAATFLLERRHPDYAPPTVRIQANHTTDALSSADPAALQEFQETLERRRAALSTTATPPPHTTPLTANPPPTRRRRGDVSG